ncbi:MAG: hypothetical protein QG635_2334, partial [Bacteroidota bacterium]|nr:hypothetical protein [Bacteroidota bacterium]
MNVTLPGDASSKPTGITDELTSYGFTINSMSPNPSSGKVTIDFQLSKSDLAFIAVFDISGNLVRNLLFETKAAGNYKTAWNGMDNNDIPVQSGIYLIVMRNAGNSVVRKVTVVK